MLTPSASHPEIVVATPTPPSSQERHENQTIARYHYIDLHNLKPPYQNKEEKREGEKRTSKRPVANQLLIIGERVVGAGGGLWGEGREENNTGIRKSRLSAGDK
jgi:uncharacterized protein YgiM (DUF1202 family)